MTTRPTSKGLPRKLLIATIGAATVNYVAACGGSPSNTNQGTQNTNGNTNTSGDTTHPDEHIEPATSGNLMAPVDPEPVPEPPPTTGNLPAPQQP